MTISDAFLVKLKLSPQPAYRLCQMAGVNPTTLSKLVRGIEPLRLHDPRIVAVGEVLGLRPEECFSEPKERIR